MYRQHSHNPPHFNSYGRPLAKRHNCSEPGRRNKDKQKRKGRKRRKQKRSFLTKEIRKKGKKEETELNRTRIIENKIEKEETIERSRRRIKKSMRAF